MARPLPPLNALRAFESAGRHLSFTKAAAELNVTPAAIGHQVKAPEELLEVPLFRRLTRALRLTDAGQAALPTLRQGFDKLAQGVEQMRAQRESRTLTISVSPSFGAMWLVPRLERFRSRHPDIEIRIDGTDRLVDLARDNVDVALRYGPGGYNGVRVDYLFSQVNTPVCSPALLSGEHPLGQPDDLRHHTLLHERAYTEWAQWLAVAGARQVEARRGPIVDNFSVVLQAAIDGQGVALTSEAIVRAELDDGRLVKPFDVDLDTDNAYYLVAPPRAFERPNVQAFRDFLLAELKAEKIASTSV